MPPPCHRRAQYPRNTSERNTSDKNFWLGLVERLQALQNCWQALENRSVRKPDRGKHRALAWGPN